jgi:Holliday junction DNA helicase RuvA
MIGSLRGTVVEWRSGELLVEVGGVGYRVLVPTRGWPEAGGRAEVLLFTHLHVREDALVLYGFLTREERDTFEALIGAPGVGPKLGLAILSVHAPAALRRALLDDDVDTLILVPGVGRRTAARLLPELKARLDIPELDLTVDAAGRNPRSEVRVALAGLGYGPDEVRDALAHLADESSVEALLRDALRVLAGDRSYGETSKL